MLSVVIPSYREEGIIEKAAQTISEILSKAQIAYELIFVDDGSNDGTWFKICEVRKLNPNVRGIRFSRNFGKEGASAWSISPGISARRRLYLQDFVPQREIVPR